jgi:phenylalanyl-tRNA synthetase beta chain
MTPEHLAERLGKLGIEVAGIERLGEKYKGFVVGEVLSVERHPNADRLTVCTVNTGSETLQIVCGAPNVAPGQKVPVGLVGATVPRNQHDPDGKPFVLSLVKVRGVESQGMICSEYELDLGKDADGILVLDPSAKTGRPLAKHLGRDDVAYEVELTPNRPDCLSHFGIAREIGVLTGKPPKLPPVRLKEGSKRTGEFLKITVEDPVSCPRFAARMLRGVRIGSSPAWLQSRLANIGLRPINNIVDVTNYVMVETGHPLHAFDYALLKGGSIVVRQSVPGSGFTTLDGKTHTLPSSAVMVCDAEREVSIAGVMGGANSEIRESTVDIVLEAAYWNPASIRRTAKALGISTDASQRFERGADPNGVTYALDRAASLIHQLAGGVLLKGTIDVYPKKIRERVIPLRTERVNTVLGTQLRQNQIAGFLAKLGIRSTKGKPGTLRCVIPTFRVDQEREIDLIEEVARVFGYDRIELKTSTLVNLDQAFPLKTLPDSTREVLIGAGFAETISSSTTDERSARLAGPEPVKLLNPLGVETAFMRTSLIPGLLESVARNQNFGNNDLRLFEIGHVFSVDASATDRFVEDYAEAEKVALLLAGEAQPVQWSMTPRKVDLYDIKGAVSALVEKISLDKCDFIYYRTSDGLTDSALAIEINGGYAGYLGRVKPSLLTDLGIAGEVFIAELRLASLVPGKVKHYEQLSRYPKVRRDISLFVDVAVPVGEIEELIRRAAGELLSSVVLFDLYQGEKAPEGKKSLAFSLELMSRQKTLTEAEIEGSVRRVVDALAKEFGAVLRSVQ